MTLRNYKAKHQNKKMYTIYFIRKIIHTKKSLGLPVTIEISKKKDI